MAEPINAKTQGRKETQSENSFAPSRLRAFALNSPIMLLRGWIAVMVPVLLVLLIVRLVMTPLYLSLEYQRPGFPADVYGFTLQDRLHYAPFAVNYLHNGEGIAYLGDLRFAGGRALFTDRELGHMYDVKVVTQAAFTVTIIAGLVTLLAVYWLWRAPERRRNLWLGLRSGSLITLGLIAAIVILSVVSWDVFFTGFHNLFFAEGSWMFLYSDTLIRLFPEQFWFDTALVIGGLTTLGAAALLILSSRKLSS